MFAEVVSKKGDHKTGFTKKTLLDIELDLFAPSFPET